MMIKPLSCAAAKLMFPLALAGSLALGTTSAQADMYKWVDSDNEVQYTQMPPPKGVKSTRIEAVSPRAQDPAEAGTSPQERLKASEKDKQQKAEATADAEQQAEFERIEKQNCITARQNLEKLGLGGKIRYRTEDGEVKRLTDEDRKQRVEEAQGQIKEFCKD